MTLDEKTVRSVGSTTDGSGFDRLGQADLSGRYDITEGEREQGTVEKYLFLAGAVGEDAAIPSAQIQKALGFETIRGFREAVAFERQAGALILGGSRGLFLPCDGELGIPELARHISTSLARAGGIYSGLRPACRELERRREGVEGNG